MKTLQDFVTESSLSRIYSRVGNHSAGMLTAFRGDFTRSENKTRNKKLLAYLLSKGYSVTKVKGSYIENYKTDTQQEVGESSFFVANLEVDGDDGGKLAKDLIKLGKLYDQDSVLIIPADGETKPYLIGTSRRDNAFPSYGKKQILANASFGSGNEFFSRIRGRKFTFESAEEIGLPITNNGRYVQNRYAREVSEELRNLT